jgi:hypothetical protein
MVMVTASLVRCPAVICGGAALYGLVIRTSAREGCSEPAGADEVTGAIVHAAPVTDRAAHMCANNAPG